MKKNFLKFFRTNWKKLGSFFKPIRSKKGISRFLANNKKTIIAAAATGGVSALVSSLITNALQNEEQVIIRDTNTSIESPEVVAHSYDALRYRAVNNMRVALNAVNNSSALGVSQNSSAQENYIKLLLNLAVLIMTIDDEETYSVATKLLTELPAMVSFGAVPTLLDRPEDLLPLYVGEDTVSGGDLDQLLLTLVQVSARGVDLAGI